MERPPVSCENRKPDMTTNIATMLASSLVAAIVMAGICAVIQAVVKVRAHRQLTRLHRELDQARQEHIEAMQVQYQRQCRLCADLGLSEPPLPEILQPQEEPDPTAKRRLRIPVRLPFRQNGSLLQHAPRGSSVFIVGRYGASFAASTVWKTSSGNILRLLTPVTSRLLAFGPRVAGFVPRFAAAGGGATGSIAAGTGVRFALGAISIIGLIIGPALTAWAVYRELRKVRRARIEQAETLAQFSADIAAMAHRTAELEAQLPVGDPTVLPGGLGQTREPSARQNESETATQAFGSTDPGRQRPFTAGQASEVALGLNPVPEFFGLPEKSAKPD